MYVCVRSVISCALSVTEMIIKNFGALIKTTVNGQLPITVDIAAEERSVCGLKLKVQVMLSRCGFVLSWALNYPLIVLYCIIVAIKYIFWPAKSESRALV